MAAAYTIASARQTTQVISQTQTADVMAVGIYTVPSGIYVNVVVPLKAWLGDAYQTLLTRPAQWIEQLIGGGLVSSAQWFQATDASDLLAGYVRFTVSYTPSDGSGGTSSQYVVVPMTILELADPFDAPLPGGGTLSTSVIDTYNTLVTKVGGPASDKVG